ncbi:MAG: permease [Planctomycetes bacterium]|nr:permease [Planctomycetota bacterium]
MVEAVRQALLAVWLSLPGIVQGFWANLLDMAPYLLFGFLVAGMLSVMLRPETVERHLGGRGLWPVVKAAAFGVPLPLCSCGVIPVSASLRRHGASRGATTAFLLSTPQTGVDSIMVTLSLLGPVFAIFRPIAALATGVFGGALVAFFERERGARMAADSCQDACCAGEEQRNRLLRILAYGFVTLPRDIGKALIVGLLLAGIIAVLVPKDMASAYGTGFVGMLVMMALGIPIYVCATASVPIAAALVAKGVSPGAALAFLIAGPATNAATIAVVWKTMGRRTALLYLASVAAASLGCGALLDLIYTHTGTAVHHHAHELLPHWAKLASGVLLLGVLGFALLWRPKVEAIGYTVTHT